MNAQTRKQFLDPTKEAQAVKSLRETLGALGAEDETLLLDTIEGETSLFEIIDALLLRRAEAEGMARGVGLVVEDLKARQARLEKRADTDRALIEQALMTAELDKLERPAATLSMTRRAPRLEISEESEIPSSFWKSPEPVLDKKAVLAALKEGAAVPGACLSNSAPSVTIRVR